MSQSRHGEFDHHGELDPLLAFNAERAAPESPQKPVDPTPPAAAPKADDALPLRLRLDQAERSLDRAQSEIAALKSNLATLVTAVDEIKKRLSRRPEVVTAPRPVPKPPRTGLLKAVMVLIVCLTIGAAVWLLASGRMIKVREAFESVSSPAPSVADPAEVPTPSEPAPLSR